jgi:UDP-N-acetylglucosamine:LPS N-acetylglucosamine transferase
MGKAERNRVRNARERIAEQQAAVGRAEQRRRLLVVGGSVGFVLVVVIALILFRLAKPFRQAPSPGT